MKVKEFNGITIHLFFRNEHNKPHIHVYYAEFEASVQISTGEIKDGFLPPRQHRLVKEWLKSEGVKEKLTKGFQKLNPHLRG